MENTTLTFFICVSSLYVILMWKYEYDLLINQSNILHTYSAYICGLYITDKLIEILITMFILFPHNLLYYYTKEVNGKPIWNIIQNYCSDWIF